MRSLAWVVLGAGCTGSVDQAPILRVEPAVIDLVVDVALPPPAVALHVLTVGADGVERDVTSAAMFTLDGRNLGAVVGGTLTSDGLTGGAATMRIAYDRLEVTVPVTAHVTGRRIVDGAPAGAALAFTTATPTAFAAHLDPGDGAVLPPGLGRMVVSFAAPDLDDAQRVVVTAPFLDLEIVAPGVPGPRELELLPSEWGAITHTARGGALELAVQSLQSSAPAVAHVTTVGLELADLDPSSLLAGGTIGDPTDQAVVRPSLWRYDMHAGVATQMFANPTGACIGCHIAVSPDGGRIAALMVAPATGGNINGVVFDPSGTVLAQSDPASATPWATATFDPGGELLAGWQGQLSLRDANTGATLAPIAMTEAAAAPTISPDGSALAYVTLDAGFSAGASQPIGNALHVRPWNAATASVGAPVELVREPRGVLLPVFSSDGKWIAYGHPTTDATRLNEVPVGAAAVRTDGSGKIVELTSDPLDKLAHWASPIAPASVGNRAPQPMVWIAVVSTRPVGGQTTSPQQLWLEAFYPELGILTPAFHLPGQPANLKILHGPIALP